MKATGETDNTLAPAERIPAANGQPSDAIDLLRSAVERGVPVEVLERLTALHERISARQAEAAFGGALAKFQAQCPSIPKSSRAQITTKSGVRYSYQYAELDEIARIIRPLLEQCGLSYTWDCTLDGEIVKCICTLRHSAGHAVTATFAAPIDSAASMSGPQRVASALTYGRRQALVQVLGLTMTEADTDDASPATITTEQVEGLQQLIDESGADAQRFLRYMEVGGLSEIKAVDYAAAVAALEAKRRQKVKP